MPIKLTSREYRVIAVAAAVSAVSLAVSVKYFRSAFPEASIEFRLDRKQSEPVARKFLAERGLRTEGYRHAAIFDYHDETKVYLERTQGLDRLDKLTRGPVRLWRWSHRWFKPQQKEEFGAEVSPAGDVVAFDHIREEAAPGASLDAAEARSVAEKFLSEVMKRNLDDLEFVETETQKRPARTDHTFTWKQKSVELGDGSLRVEVGVRGNHVARYNEYVKIPEQWSRDYAKLRSRNDSAQVADQVGWLFLTVALIVILVMRLRDHDVPVRLAVGFGSLAAALFFFGQLNDFSSVEFGYPTTISYSSFMADFLQRSLGEALAAGAWIFILVAGSEPVYRKGFPAFVSFRRYLSWEGLRTRSFLIANVVGIALTFFFFAYQTIFYLTANHLGAWAPADINYSDLLNTRVPWVWVLFGGFFPAVSEEMQFRAFALPFLKKLVRSWPLAIVLAAFNWGFLHSAYPNQPFFIRGVEVGLGGIVTGLIMLRFGILATLIWHYSVDALYTAFLLLRSHNHSLMLSGAVTAGIMLVPLVLALVAYLRSGTFSDEEPLSNAREEARRPPRREEAVAAAEMRLAYQPLAKSRLMLAVLLTVILAGIAVLPVYRFGEGIKLRITRTEATLAADDFLKARHVPAATFRQVAWVEENLDPLALRYLLERRSVEETDRIYRQATRLVLWEVRYFQPLVKEEHFVFVDAENGKVFAYRHLLDENAPGATLSPDDARRLAQKALEDHGYRLSDFELQESRGEKRKARQDYTLVWQAKAGDPRNVGDAHYRLEVEIAGDEVVGFVRLFKLPEDWEREHSATHLANQILKATRYLLLPGLILGVGLILFVRQLRNGKIPWRAAAKVGAAIGGITVLSELNELHSLYRQYSTSIPLSAFQLFLVGGLIIAPLVSALAVWVLVGLATSLYPDAWKVFRGPERRVWRRDAAVAIVVSLAVGASMSRLGLLAAEKFHAFMPVRIDLIPGLAEALSPGAGFLVQSLVWSVFAGSLAAVIIYAVRFGISSRAWWLWLGGFFLLVNLGSWQAHSVAEYFSGWALNLVSLALTVAIVAWFFRDNVLAYIAALFTLQVAEPVIDLLSQPPAFYHWNGLLLAVLALAVLGWLLVPGREAPPGVPAE